MSNEWPPDARTMNIIHRSVIFSNEDRAQICNLRKAIEEYTQATLARVVSQGRRYVFFEWGTNRRKCGQPTPKIR